MRWPAATRARSLRTQVVVLTALVVSLLGACLVGAVHVAVSGATTSGADHVLRNRAHAVTDAVRGASDARLQVPEAVLDPGVAVYDSRGEVVAGEIPASLASDFAALSASTEPATAQSGERYRLRAEPFSTDAGAGVVVVAESLDPYERAEHTALLVATVAAVLCALVATVVAAGASRRALAPVTQMAATAQQWSEHDLDRRFGHRRPGNEIEELGATLDGLLDKVASAIHAEQRLTSELAHELRTPLTALLGTAELISMRDDLDDELRADIDAVVTRGRQMAATMATLLDLARASREDLPDRPLVSAVLARVAREAGGDALTVQAPQDLRVAMSEDLAVRAVAPVVANAVRLAEHVDLSAHREGEHVVVVVADDGPGIEPSTAETIFRPGHSGSGGSGLGLPLARRIARAFGGDVRSVEVADGARFEVLLPAQ